MENVLYIFNRSIINGDSLTARDMIDEAEDLGADINKIVDMCVVYNKTFGFEDPWQDYARTELRAITQRI
jgi:hypothetical protein